MSYEAVVEKWQQDLKRAGFHTYISREYGLRGFPRPRDVRNFELARAYSTGLRIILSALHDARTPAQFADNVDSREAELESVLADVNPSYQKQADERIRLAVRLVFHDLARHI